MRFRQPVTTVLMTLLMLALAAAGMTLILANTRPLEPERLTVPDIGK
ncbi:MAG: hypothetical protein P4L72_14635 [Parvibaculum sp.]|jgi:hypothetical protein|nr:hypothetical protein [Parvibaculum sp.]MDR3500449.1 hypothetical protein [Parvibaculum sp.]